MATTSLSRVFILFAGLAISLSLPSSVDSNILKRFISEIHDDPQIRFRYPVLSKLSVELLPRRLYELSANFILTTLYNETLQLSSRNNQSGPMRTEHLKTSSERQRTVLIVNGKTRRSILPPYQVTVRKNAEFVSSQMGFIYFISSGSKLLLHVDPVNYPNVFVDIQAEFESENQDAIRAEREEIIHHQLLNRILAQENAARSTKRDTFKIPYNDCLPGRKLRKIEISLVSDYSFCKYYGENETLVQMKMRHLFWKAEGAFASVSCLRFVLASIEINCDAKMNPYNSTQNQPSSTKLYRFISTWNAKYGQLIRKDITIFLSAGNRVDSSTGIAFVGSVCTSMGSAWVLGSRPDDYVVKTLSHEIGHTLGLLHYHSGLMMQGGKPTQLAPPSTASLISFLRTANANCITELGPPAKATASPSASPESNGTLRIRPLPTQFVSCSSSRQALNCFPFQSNVFRNFKEVGNLRRFVNFSRHVSLASRVQYGNIYLRVSAPTVKDDHRVFGEISYGLSYMIAMIGFNNAPLNLIVDYSQLSSQQLAISEADLYVSSSILSCCRQKLFMNIQTTLQARAANRVIASQAIIANVYLPLTCKTCGGRFSPMSSSSKCPKCISS